MVDHYLEELGEYQVMHLDWPMKVHSLVKGSSRTLKKYLNEKVSFRGRVCQLYVRFQWAIYVVVAKMSLIEDQIAEVYISSGNFKIIKIAHLPIP